MNTRQSQKADTRRRIVARAMRLCGDRGFAQMRTADVARAARLSHGAIFVHFPTREDLLLAVAERIGQEITLRLHQLATHGASLREVLKAHLAAIEEREDEYRRLVIDRPMLPQGFQVGWTCLQSAVSHHIAQAAQREMDAKVIRRMPMHLLFNTWLGLLHHYLAHQELFAPGRSVLAEHGKELLDHFLHLLQTRD
jgi:AcrR family transcriptional regulator